MVDWAKSITFRPDTLGYRLGNNGRIFESWMPSQH